MNMSKHLCIGVINTRHHNDDMAMKEVDNIYGESIGEINWKKKTNKNNNNKKAVVLPLPFPEDDSNLSTVRSVLSL